MNIVLLSESTVTVPPLQGSYRRYVRNGQCRQPLQRPSTQIQQRITVSGFTVVQSARRGDPGVANQGNPGNVGQNSRSEAAMTVKLFAFTCGTVTGEFARLMECGEGDITVPIPVFLIEHPKGRALFGDGLHPDCQHDPVGRLGPRLAELFRIGFRPGEEVSARLEAIDRDPGKIDLVINSHFHFDQVGGNALLPNATMLVQRREWDAGMDPDTAARRGFNPRDFDLGHKLRLVDGEHDVFGDGSVMCLPTHGHTPGHQSLRLRLDGGEVVLAADACYFCQTLREHRLPRYMHDREAMMARLTGWRRWNAAGRASSSGTIPNSGKRCPKRRYPSHDAAVRSCSSSTT